MERRGFTLIELLVVIAIIGLLAGVVLSSLNSARDSARKSAAMAQLRAIRSGVALLEAETGKWPNGCTANIDSGNSEVDLSTTNAGLASFPALGTLPITTDGAANPDCEWTATDYANWRGPYISVAVDPWGSPYYWDPDYQLSGGSRGSCSPPSGTVTVIYSPGKNESAVNSYDCDDIVYMLNSGTFAP